MQNDNDSIAFHYCTTSAFLNIVKHEAIWASNVFLMNDYMEVKWLLAKARRNISERCETGQSNRSELVTFYKNLDNRILRHGFDHIYVSCFSAKDDDLSQWRAYADDGHGVAIGVDLESVRLPHENRKVEAVDVVYDENEQMRLVDGILTTFERRSVGESVKNEFYNPILEVGQIHSPGVNANLAFRALSKYAASCKNPKFADEAETRLIIQPRNAPRHWDRLTYNAEYFEEFPSEIDFRCGSSAIVPFTKVRLRRSAIQRVRLGPKFGEDEREASIRFFVSSLGMDHEIVCRSAASLR